MASRHQRRKKAALKKQAIQKAKVQSLVADGIKAIVKANLAKPITQEERLAQRAWAGIGGTLSKLQSSSHRGYVCRASGNMGRRSALALKAKGSY
jgi:hypothetical protein